MKSDQILPPKELFYWGNGLPVVNAPARPEWTARQWSSPAATLASASRRPRTWRGGAPGWSWLAGTWMLPRKRLLPSRKTFYKVALQQTSALLVRSKLSYHWAIHLNFHISLSLSPIFKNGFLRNCQEVRQSFFTCVTCKPSPLAQRMAQAKSYTLRDRIFV